MNRKLGLTCALVCAAGVAVAVSGEVVPGPISHVVRMEPTPLGQSMFLAGTAVLKSSPLGDSLTIRLQERILNEPTRLEGLSFVVTVERRQGDGGPIAFAYDVAAATMRDGSAEVLIRGWEGPSPAFPVRLLQRIQIRYQCRDVLIWTRP